MFEPYILTPILINAVAVLGLYIIVNSGRISAGHAVYVAVGSYVTALIIIESDVSIWIAFLPAILISGMLGTFFALLAEQLEHWFFAVATLAFGIMLSGLVGNLDLFGGPLGLYGTRADVDLPIAVLALISAVLLVFLFDRSGWGRETRAVRDSPVAAEAIGINVYWVHVRAFAIGSALAGLAGALRMGYIGSVDPTAMSFHVSLLFLVFLTVGGSWRISGALGGALVLGFLPESLRAVGTYRLEFYGLLVIAVMIFRPAGFVPSLSDIRSLLGFFTRGRWQRVSR